MNKMVDGLVVLMTAAEVAEAEAEAAVAVAEEAANGYKRNRANEYPAITDQLDDIFHNGIDQWKTTIQATKNKYPKP